MKKLLMAAMILSTIVSSCATSKLDSKGNKVATWNTKHMQKIHPQGFYAAGHYIVTNKDKKVVVKK